MITVTTLIISLLGIAFNKKVVPPSSYEPVEFMGIEEDTSSSLVRKHDNSSKKYLDFCLLFGMYGIAGGLMRVQVAWVFYIRKLTWV